MTERRMMNKALIVVLCWALAACTAPPPPLRIGLLAWPPHQIAHLAREMSCEGVRDVELVDFGSLSDAARAYDSGNLDAVGLTMDYALDFHARDSRHRVFLFVDESAGGDAVIGPAAMTGPAQLRGKRVGLEDSALGAYMLQRMLDTAGLARSDIETVYVDYAGQAAAFLDGRVDAIITGEPTRSALLQAGGREIFSSRDIPGEVIDVFMARQDDLEARGDEFAAFTRCWFEALARFGADPHASAAFMGAGLQIAPGEFLATMHGVRMHSLAQNRRMLAGAEQAALHGVVTLARTLGSMGKSNRVADVRSVLTTAALPPAK